MKSLFKGVIGTAALAGMLASPIASAQAAPVRTSQPTADRAATATQRNAQLGAAPVWLIALLGALAVAGVIAAATSGGNGNQSPESP